ncbi:TPA: LamG domain-containing protein [Candidatus Poribacteria bacterium]|nr:LamG domain-containing protein [Candidatus Poribacteria bacterium]
MRTLALALWIMSLVVALGTVGSAANKFDKNFVIHYSFDKGKGDEVKDISGESNHGELMNGAKREKKGKFGSGIGFGNGNSYIETIIDVPEFNFTMALWIKTSEGNVGIYSVLDGAAGAGGHDRHFFLSGGKISFRTWQGPGWPTNKNVADGKWHHIALVVQDEKGQTAYVDGEKVGTHTYDHSDFDWQKRVWVGFSNDAAVDYFEGVIDEVAYLDVPLTKKEIGALMKPLAVDASDKLVAVWSNIKTDY